MQRQNLLKYGLLAVAAAIIVGVGVFVYVAAKHISHVYQNTNQAATQNLPKLHRTTAADPITHWKTYTWKQGNLAFRYPADWYVRADPITNRVSISNVATPPPAIGRPSYYEQVWLSMDEIQAGVVHEASVQAGHPTDRPLAAGPRSSGEISVDDTIIHTYQYYTSGGPTLEAFWRVGSQRYYATTATQVGQANQADMVAMLKKVLGTLSLPRD